MSRRLKAVVILRMVMKSNDTETKGEVYISRADRGASIASRYLSVLSVVSSRV